MLTVGVAFYLLSFSACKKNQDETVSKVRSLPNKLASATQIDTVNATAVLPLYRGQDANGGDVFYIITNQTTLINQLSLV